MDIEVVGLDLAKNVFQVEGLDERGRALLRRQLRRSQVLNFFANSPPALESFNRVAKHHVSDERNRASASGKPVGFRGRSKDQLVDEEPEALMNHCGQRTIAQNRPDIGLKDRARPGANRWRESARHGRTRPEADCHCDRSKAIHSLRARCHPRHTSLQLLAIPHDICTAPVFQLSTTTTKSGTDMKRIVITRTCAGQWLYMIYIDDRAVVVGMCSTRAAAETQANLA